MTENSAMKTFQNGVIFVRKTIMMKGVVGTKESLSVTIARNLAMYKKIVNLEMNNKLVLHVSQILRRGYMYP